MANGKWRPTETMKYQKIMAEKRAYRMTENNGELVDGLYSSIKY